MDKGKRDEKENEKPFIEMSLDFSEMEIPDEEVEDYGVDISLPSMPRAPPPKPKGRPHKIKDTCAQTVSIYFLFFFFQT